MDEMEEKIGNILNNPQLMQQIMSMAQAMGGPGREQSSEKPPRNDSAFPDIDMATIQKISGLAQKSNIDKREKALLSALGAYLGRERIGKLEKAMRAAKIAKIASSALSAGGVSSLIGR